MHKNNTHDEIVDFMISNGAPYLSKEDKPWLINNVRIYNDNFELLVIEDDGEIKVVGLAMVSGDILYVKELFIDIKVRGLTLLKRLVVHAKITYKEINKIMFERIAKDNHVGIRVYDIKNLFRGEKKE